MFFNSYHFLIFFPIVVCLYYILPQKTKKIWLVISSYYFYMCWNPRYIVLLLLVTCISYFTGRVISIATISTKNRKTIVLLGISLTMSLLVFFKYMDFLWKPVYSLLILVGINPVISSFDIVLPVGISFYTFQAVGYMMDVYKGRVVAEKNYIDYSLFIAFFPQLVAGPIERTEFLITQLREQHRLKYENIRDGIMLMLWGFFMKLVIADRAALFVDRVYDDYGNSGGLFLIVATIFFGFQIYCDFSGYSTIAMGAARVLGIKLSDNFNGPYLSRNVADFWRNWHISLTSWFRDYVYIPLGGNKKGVVRRNINLLVVFFLSGLWHGAEWSFVIWGGLNGIYQIVGYYVKPIKNKVLVYFRINKNAKLLKLVETVSTFILVDFAWIFFRADSIRDALKIIKRMFIYFDPKILTNGLIYERNLNATELYFLIISIIILLIADSFKRRGISIRQIIYAQKGLIRYFFYLFAVLFILIFGTYGSNYGSSFIYFQF